MALLSHERTVMNPLCEIHHDVHSKANHILEVYYTLTTDKNVITNFIGIPSSHKLELSLLEELSSPYSRCASLLVNRR